MIAFLIAISLKVTTPHVVANRILKSPVDTDGRNELIGFSSDVTGLVEVDRKLPCVTVYLYKDRCQSRGSPFQICGTATAAERAKITSQRSYSVSLGQAGRVDIVKESGGATQVISVPRNIKCVEIGRYKFKEFVVRTKEEAKTLPVWTLKSKFGRRNHEKDPNVKSSQERFYQGKEHLLKIKGTVYPNPNLSSCVAVYFGCKKSDKRQTFCKGDDRKYKINLLKRGPNDFLMVPGSRVDRTDIQYFYNQNLTLGRKQMCVPKNRGIKSITLHVRGTPSKVKCVRLYPQPGYWGNPVKFCGSRVVVPKDLDILKNDFMSFEGTEGVKNVSIEFSKGFQYYIEHYPNVKRNLIHKKRVMEVINIE